MKNGAFKPELAMNYTIDITKSFIASTKDSMDAEKIIEFMSKIYDYFSIAE